MVTSDIVTGEKVQLLCDLYFGYPEDFQFNPLIRNNPTKHFNIHHWIESIENPKCLFCYSHRIKDLSNRIHLLKNPFVLVTHNSDENLVDCQHVQRILSCPNLIQWFGQNVGFPHEKLQLIPIGFANQMWKHGNLSLFEDATFLSLLEHNLKSKKIYFQFNIQTNFTQRKICYDQLIHKLDWVECIEPLDNLKRLREYQFCICPEGNGYDTHRLWEALYLKVVPIVLKNPFTTILQYHLPMVVLDKWEDLDVSALDYNQYSFDGISNTVSNFNKLKDKIYKQYITMKKSIVCLTRGYNKFNEYSNLIKRNKHIERQLQDKEIDIVIFHEGNIHHQTEIQKETPSLHLIFIDVSKNDIAFKKEYESLTIDPETSFHGWGYRHMCSFWFVDFWKFVEEYDSILRIDEDCYIEFIPETVFEALEKTPIVCGKYDKDLFHVTKGMNDHTLQFMMNHGYSSLETKLPNGPYTNVVGFHLPYLRNIPILHKYIESIKDTKCIYTQRWGDLPLWGEAIYYILGESSLFIDKNLRYFHESHHCSVNQC